MNTLVAMLAGAAIATVVIGLTPEVFKDRIKKRLCYRDDVVLYYLIRDLLRTMQSRHWGEQNFKTRDALVEVVIKGLHAYRSTRDHQALINGQWGNLEKEA